MEISLELDVLALDELVAYSRFATPSAYLNSLIQREHEQLSVRQMIENGDVDMLNGAQMELNIGA
jgi:hypothetical protein